MVCLNTHTFSLSLDNPCVSPLCLRCVSAVSLRRYPDIARRSPWRTMVGEPLTKARTPAQTTFTQTDELVLLDYLKRPEGLLKEGIANPLTVIKIEEADRWNGPVNITLRISNVQATSAAAKGGEIKQRIPLLLKVRGGLYGCVARAERSEKKRVARCDNRL